VAALTAAARPTGIGRSYGASLHRLESAGK